MAVTKPSTKVWIVNVTIVCLLSSPHPFCCPHITFYRPSSLYSHSVWACIPLKHCEKIDRVFPIAFGVGTSLNTTASRPHNSDIHIACTSVMFLHDHAVLGNRSTTFQMMSCYRATYEAFDNPISRFSSD